jgi:hypothetical protein
MAPPSLGSKNKPSSDCCLLSYLSYYLTRMMEGICFFETLVYFKRATPRSRALHNHRCANRKSNKFTENCFSLYPSCMSLLLRSSSGVVFDCCAHAHVGSCTRARSGDRARRALSLPQCRPWRAGGR